MGRRAPSRRTRQPTCTPYRTRTKPTTAPAVVANSGANSNELRYSATAIKITPASTARLLRPFRLRILAASCMVTGYAVSVGTTSSAGSHAKASRVGPRGTGSARAGGRSTLFPVSITPQTDLVGLASLGVLALVPVVPPEAALCRFVHRFSVHRPADDRGASGVIPGPPTPHPAASATATGR